MGAMNADVLTAFVVPESMVSPFEFRSLADEDITAMEALFGEQAGTQGAVLLARKHSEDEARDRATHETTLLDATGKAREEGRVQGEQEGRRAARAEMEEEMKASAAEEQARVVAVVKDFAGARERYFTGVEQEVVKLSLAIAGRVLHREAQIDPLLLSAVVRVALDKMQDRSGVVLRVAESDVSAWENLFQTTEESERPRVMQDAKMRRGDCVLDTKMGTVELGVSVQLEEIEKGFFDLLNHKPVA
jgi:flagellar biosynthesis/type III secretory pathway protein FliH